ncbi:hypothetical protein BX600DRAFT_482888 [Xylariales sp. PMI_506]|nr:hypothetical protein BX600DRAFT_482888 [Xylariales sp. PMI_506]
MTDTYDFIIVGGNALAAGLAKSDKKPSVLLLEAGTDYPDRNLRIDGQRWQTFMKPNMNWGYKTVPQTQCANREIDYSRGKGIGGSSAINFGVYTIGARDDYDEWAKIVGDDTFRWEKMQHRFKALETFHGNIPSTLKPKYAAPKAEDHGHNGPLQVGYAAEWEDDIPPMLDVFEEAGYQINQDHNSGNPLGISILINSATGGLRSTSKDLLTPPPGNLTILTSSPVQRVIVEGNRAVGVESNGKTYHASVEVVLSTGALDSPKILMHSGIGPKESLENFGIAVKQNLPAVGKGLRDHMFSPLLFTRAEGSTSRKSFYGDENAMQSALEQWKKDSTGPWSKYACEGGIGFFKLDAITSSQEFHDLSAEEKLFLQAETVPHMEVITHFPMHWFLPNFPPEDLDYSCLLVFLYNAQSRGEVTLQSSDPNVPLLFDPKFLDHPFDRRAAIESLRAMIQVTKTQAYSKNTVAKVLGPASESDEDLLDYWRQTISSSWHMSGTLKMGKESDTDAVVDSDFRVFGTQGLRVADMSTVPVLPSAHLQAVAYVIGVTCAEKLVAEYHLK